MKDSSHLEVGEWGEKLAARYLKKNKYRIMGTRVRVGKRDEIDIVARDKGVLVFVEVKTRKTERFGRPADSVNKKKRSVLSRAAIRYIGKLKNKRIYFRFDVIEIIGIPGQDDPELRHIQNAFTLDKRYTLPA